MAPDIQSHPWSNSLISGHRSDEIQLDLFEAPHFPDSFEDMLCRWRRGEGVDDYIHRVIQRPDSWICVFSPSVFDKKDIFDLICTKVQSNEQIPLAKSFLLAFAERPLKSLSMEYRCWGSVFIEPSWTSFKKFLPTIPLNRCMSQVAAKLVHECTFVLVGERLLGVYKEQLDWGHALSSKDNISEEDCRHREHYAGSVVHYFHCEQHDAILRDFRSRCTTQWNIIP